MAVVYEFVVEIVAEDKNENNLVYGECMKNFGTIEGTHIRDGCGQFAPDALGSRNCEACGCHMNFHINRNRNHIYNVLVQQIDNINGDNKEIAQPRNSHQSVITQLLEVEENDSDLDNELSSEKAPESRVEEEKKAN